jgi:hypothetical protein
LKILKLLILIACLSCPLNNKGATLTTNELESIANAAYKAEGSEKAKVPYGILSVKVKNKEEAKQVCINTIINNYQRWQEAGRPEEFISYLAKRYTGGANKTETKNWLYNVRFFLNKEDKDFIKKINTKN